MSKYRYDIEQNTDEWTKIKLGKFSASTCPELLMSKNTKGYQGLIARIVEERITGKQSENNSFKGNAFTNRGHEFEPIARLNYELRTLQTVDIVGVVELDDWTLCSPDGLIGEDGLHQIKCPIFSTQKEYLFKLFAGDSPISSNYYKQMQFELFVTKRKYNVFTSFHPNLSPIDIKLYRDENLISEIKQRLEEAKIEVLNEINRILNLKR